MMPGIPIVERKNPGQDWKATAEDMLDRLYKKCELEVYSECPKVYMLRKEGVLYQAFNRIISEYTRHQTPRSPLIYYSYHRLVGTSETR